MSVLRLAACFALALAAGCAAEPTAELPTSTNDLTSTAGIADAMPELAFLAGTWHGKGWIRTGPGAPETFEETETVAAQVGGHAVTMEGVGTDGADGPVVHHAFAILWKQGGELRMRSFTGEGYTVEGTVRVGDNTLAWGFGTGPQQQRFTITVGADSRWHETGEISRDGGTTWTPFFEMDLDQLAM